jgi:hypothetical protein
MPRRTPHARKTEDLTFEDALARIIRWLAKRARARKPASRPLDELVSQHLASHREGNPVGGDLECKVIAVAIQLKAAIAGDEGAPHVGNLADALAGVRLALVRAMKTSLKEPLAELARAWTIYEQAATRERHEVLDSLQDKLPVRKRLRRPPPAWVPLRLFAQLRAALLHLEREVRGRQFSPALCRLRPARERDTNRATIEKLFKDAGVTYAETGEILYGDRSDRMKALIRDRCRRSQGLPQGARGLL